MLTGNITQKTKTMDMKNVICALSMIMLFTATASGQIGTIDGGFQLGSGFGPGNSDGRCETIVQQSDGKLLVGGFFTEYDGDDIVRLARLNLDGSIDVNFQTGDGFTGVSAYVKAIALQSDGKILVGGNFLEYDGVTRHRIARLNADGSLDTGFDPLTGFDSDVSSIAVQPDGKIIVGGVFTKYDWQNGGGTNRSCIARLNADGSLDTSFDPGSGMGSSAGQKRVHQVIVQPDGKILACGLFTDYQDSARIIIVRLNADGTLDPSFNASNNFNQVMGFYGEAWHMELLPDGKIVIGGNFHYTGSGKGLAKLNADGSHDASFALNNGGVTAFAVQSDGKVIVSASGPYTVKRYNADGTADAGFSETTLNDWAKKMIVQADGNVTLVGHFYYNPAGIMRLTGDTPNTTGIGIVENPLAGITLYPNPAGDFLNIGNIPAGSTVKITALTGKLVYSITTGNTQTVISTAGFVNGVYMVNIENAGNVMSRKLVVNK